MVKFLGSPLEIPDALTTTQAVRKAVTDALATRVTSLESSSASSAGFTVVTKTAAYTAVASNFVLANATSAAFTVTLPSGPTTGTRVAVKKIDTTTNSVTVVGSNSTTIDGDTSCILAAPQVGAVFCFDGSNWQIQSVALFDAGGQNLTFRGAYSTSTAYAANDVVYYLGNAYIALVANTNVAPTVDASSATWNLLVLHGTNGTNGNGVPTGGTAGYVLAKNSATSYDTVWVNPQTLGPVRASSVSGLPTGVPLGTRGFTTDLQMDWIYSSLGGSGTWLPATSFVAFFGYQSNNTQSVSNNTATAMLIDSWSNYLATYNSTTGVVTLTYSGWYEFSGIVHFYPGTTGIRQAWWNVNGSALPNSGNQLVPNSSAINTSLPFKAHVQNTPSGAQITPMILQTNGAALSLQSNSTFSCGITIKYLGQGGTLYA